METAANFIRSGRYKKVIIVGADKMSSMVDYTAVSYTHLDVYKRQGEGLTDSPIAQLVRALH